MEKAIEIVESKLRVVRQYSHLASFKSRELILVDVLKELKNGNN